MERVNTFFQKNSSLLATVGFLIIIVYLKSLFPTHADMEKLELNHNIEMLAKTKAINSLKDRVLKLELEGGKLVGDVNVLGGRLDKKIKVVKKNTDEIDRNENDIIYIKAKME